MPLDFTRIGRIRIDALLGAGGMGEVYRGWDEKLERPVALKVVHADKRLSPAVHMRFLREARVLSQLDHPNICRIYDVLEREDGDYLVLELVEGTTLRARMEGELTKAEALDVALQVARVLAVTHERGIVHRDLKPENVMLTPSGQVKVLDFGLARPVAADGASGMPVSVDVIEADDVEKTAVLGRPVSSTVESHTSAGSLVGTLHYMSPEQARGLPINEASDVYSLGVMLYEMLAGRRAYGPVENMSDLLVMVRRAEVLPHDFRDRDLASLLERMLALHPADRAAAATVVRDLERIREKPARRRQRLTFAAMALLVVLAIAGAFFVSRRLAATPRLFSAPHGRIAILPFRNATGDASLNWAENGLADLVAEAASRARGAEVVRMQNVTRTMKTLRIDPQRDLTGAQRRALLTSLGADVLIAPQVVSDDGKYTIRYAALTPERVEPSREATSSVLVEAAKRMSVDLVQRIDPASSASAIRARTTLSLDAVANMLFAMGMQELRTRGPRIAAHYFTVCLDRDPEFIAAKMQLADCRKAMAEGATAERLLDEALAQARARKDREMEAQIFITRAGWFIDDGRYAQGERSAREALALGRALGDQDLVGRAYGSIGYATWRVGRLDYARAQFNEGLRIFTALRDPQQQAQLHNNLGILEESAMNPAASAVHLQKAMEIADRINDRYLAATVVGNFAGVYAGKGDFARAEELTRRQVALTEEIGDTSSQIFGLVNLGLYLWAQGKEAEAVEVTRRGATVAAKVGNPRVETVILANLLYAETKLGDLAAARTHLAAALQTFAGLDDPEVERDLRLSAAYLLTREGRLREAARELDLAEKWQVNARCLLMRARLAYAEGNYARAFALIQKSKAMGDVWLIQNEQMYRALEESARTGREATVEFEEKLSPSSVVL